MTMRIVTITASIASLLLFTYYATINDLQRRHTPLLSAELDAESPLNGLREDAACVQVGRLSPLTRGAIGVSTIEKSSAATAVGHLFVEFQSDTIFHGRGELEWILRSGTGDPAARGIPSALGRSIGAFPGGLYELHVMFQDSGMLLYDSGLFELVPGGEKVIGPINIAGLAQTVRVRVIADDGSSIERVRFVGREEPSQWDWLMRPGHTAESTDSWFRVLIPVAGDTSLSIAAKGYAPTRYIKPIDGATIKLQRASPCQLRLHALTTVPVKLDEHMHLLCAMQPMGPSLVSLEMETHVFNFEHLATGSVICQLIDLDMSGSQTQQQPQVLGYLEFARVATNPGELDVIEVEPIAWNERRNR